MSHPLLSDALLEAYASASTVAQIVETLEVQVGDPDFPALGGRAIYMCTGLHAQDFNLGAYGWRTFQPMPFKFALPAQDPTGAQALSVAIENVDGAVVSFIAHALTMNLPVLIKYRTFFADQPDFSQTPRPLVLTVSGAKVTTRGGVFSATIADFVNRTWPNGFYSYTSYPGLR